MNRKAKLAIGAICVLFVLFAVFLLVWFLEDSYPEFEGTAKEFTVPSEDGFSPQGFCSLPNNREGYDFAVSGTVKGRPSRIYFIGSHNEKAKYFTLLGDTNQEIATSFGGLFANENFLWIAGGDMLYRVSLTDAVEAENGAKLLLKDSLKLEGLSNVSVLSSYRGVLFVGERFEKGIDQSHAIETSDGKNGAMIFAYQISEEERGGIDEEYIYAISVPENVKGIAIWERGIALSISSGLISSKINYYQNLLLYSPKREWRGKPLYVLDSSSLEKSVKAPCMSEEIFEKDGKLFLVFSSSKKSAFFARERRKEAVSFQVPIIGG